MRPLFMPGEQPTFAASIRKLIGHVGGGAMLFAAIGLLTWLLGLGVDYLNGIHPFNATVLSLLHNFEVALLYGDIVLSSIVVLVGGYRFLREIAGEHR